MMRNILRTLTMLLVLMLVASFAFAGGNREEPQMMDDDSEAEAMESEELDSMEEQLAAGGSNFEGLVPVDRSGYTVGTYGGTFVTAVLSDPRTFNAWVASETSSTDVTDMLYETAVRRNQFTLDWEPATAESWEISDDQQTITINLREGMRWSDGTPITAKDYVFSYNHLMLREDVGSNSRSGLLIAPEPGAIDQPVEVTYIDDLTYSITLPTVYAGIFEVAASAPAPVHVFGPLMGFDEDVHGWEYEWELGTDEEGNEILVEIKPEGVDYAAVPSFWGVDTDVTQIVGNGPWVLTNYVPGQRVEFGPNEYYYETDSAGNQLPYLDAVVYETVEDQDTMLQRFLAGDLDNLGVRGEDFAELVGRKAELGFELYEVGPAAATQFITFNQNPIEGEGDAGIEPPQLTWLSNKTFRQAMAHLVDRQTIIDNIAFGFGYPQYSFIPFVSPYYWEGAPDAAFPFDPATAADMLDSIGYVDTDGDGWREDTDGNKISLELQTNSGNRVREAIGELFAQEAANIGIEINFRPGDFNAMVGQLLSSYDWELILIGLTGSVDPISGANVYPSSGNLHMIEPLQTTPRREWERQVDEAWIVANNTTDEAQRKAGYETIQRIWIEEVPWVYTFSPLVIGAYKTDWANVAPQPVDGYGFKGFAERVYRR